MTDTKMTGTKAKLSRRHVLITGATAGGGLAIGLQMGLGDAIAQRVLGTPGDEVAAWVVIKPNNDVVVRIARSEMGQGTLTGLAQLVAEELDADWTKVQWEYPTPGENLKRNRVWGDMSTGGSRGIRGSHDYVRQGGAAAKQMLLAAAAAELKVPVEELSGDKSIITHAKSKRTVTYGRVAAAAAKLPVPDLKTMKLKDPKDWKIAGQPLKRLDTKNKLVGKQIYSIDLKLPGMLLASIKDAPVHGNKIKSYNGDKAKVMSGVKGIYQVGASAVAVVAETWWQANKALAAVEIVYEDSPTTKLDSAEIAKVLGEGLSASENVAVLNKAGDIKAGLDGAAKKVEAVYNAPYWHHVTMEPMNATAKWTVDKCEVWTATQNGDAALAACSEAAGIAPTKCDVYKLHLGGGFGRRGMQDYVTKAVLLAKQLPGVPVKLIYSREEDMRQGFYRPISACKMEAGLDDKGNLTSLKMRITGQSILASVAPARMQNGVDFIAFQGLNTIDGPAAAEGGFGYTIPNLSIEYAMRNFHVRPGFWRGVNNNQNAYYLECFLDEVAKAAGKDPLAFRRDLMSKNPKTAKHLAVLDAVAKKAEWDKPLPEGVFRGCAQQMGYGSYVAAVAEVSVNARGKIKVHRLVMGTDSGHVVNPDQVDAQVVGSVAYGLSASFGEEITIKNGAVVQENLDVYDILRMADFPTTVETVTVPSGGFWGGVGEPTIMVAAPAVLNAVYAATGKPVRALPVKNQKLRA
jgi:isoquinoline 1-oxidoreductase subunit beta